MNKVLTCILMTAAFQHASAQMLDSPLFSFERLSWQMKFIEAAKCLGGRELKPLETHGHSLMRSSEDLFSSYYLDTMYTYRVLVALQFSKSDSLLHAVMVTFVGIDSLTKRPYDDAEDRIAKLWQKYSARLGSGEEKSMPLGGRIRVWSSIRTSVQMMSMTSISMLSITFMPNTPGENEKE